MLHTFKLNNKKGKKIFVLRRKNICGIDSWAVVLEVIIIDSVELTEHRTKTGVLIFFDIQFFYDWFDRAIQRRI